MAVSRERMQSQKNGSFLDLPSNCDRGLALLRHAAEQASGDEETLFHLPYADMLASQIRIFDPDCADHILRKYLDPLGFCFDYTVRSTAYKDFLTDDEALDKVKQIKTTYPDHWNNDIKPNIGPAPPGLGYQSLGLDEARPHAASQSFNKSGYTLADNDITPKASTFHPGGFQDRWKYRAWDSSSTSTQPKETHSGPNGHFATARYPDYATPSTNSGNFGAIGMHSKGSSADARHGDGVSLNRLDINVNSLYSNSQSAFTTDYYRSTLGPRYQHQQPSPDQPSLSALESIRANLPKPPPGATGQPPDLQAYVQGQSRHGQDALQPNTGPTWYSYDSNCSTQSPQLGMDSPLHPWTSASSQQRRQCSLRNVFDSPATEYSGDSSEAAPLEQRPAPPAPAPSSWAKIAAIPAQSQQPESTMIFELSSRNPTHAPQRSRGNTASTSAPNEKKQRVVWLANLPHPFTLRDISQQITQGPLMSINIQQDAHESLPGKSACLIFWQQEHASQFLLDNGWDFKKERFVGPTSYAASPVRSGARRHPDVARIELQPGSPYPADEWLRMMPSPTSARRRVKLNRARLFYDVSHAQFKRDVLGMVNGPQNVEFFHFYNPGECTVVLASVGIAATVVEQFRVLGREVLVGAKRWTKEEESTGTNTGAGGGGGRRSNQGEGLKIGSGTMTRRVGHLDGMKGRYEGVEVAFVKDFNEVPMTLYTHYNGDGRPLNRVEGMYEGPAVKWP